MLLRKGVKKISIPNKPMYNENKNNGIKKIETLKKIQAERRFTTKSPFIQHCTTPNTVWHGQF